ncbi:MAG: KilA-N domain-containing protein [Candidatus Peregrinibacteria bacterium]
MSPSITVQGNPIRILENAGEKYISLTDMTKEFGESDVLIANWMRKKDTIEYLGIWERLHNEYFKPLEFEGFKNEAGTNRFSISPQKWIDGVNALGIVSKSGRYGGTYAHEDIALHFGQWLSPEFSLYVIKEFKRLKQLEAQRSSETWQLSRALSKINYRIHTDAIDLHLIPQKTPQNLKWTWFTEEADILNMALFGKTAKQWRVENPQAEGNMRDFATQEQLLVLANLEVLNSQFVKEEIAKEDRLQKLNEAAITQMTSLLRSPSLKKLS